MMKMADNVSKELLDLLYNIKELAVNQTPISLISLLNSIESVGYTYFLDDERNYPKVEILEIEQNEYGCNNHICTLSVKYINDYEVVVNSCRWLYIDDLEYGVDDNGKLFHYKYRFIEGDGSERRIN